MIQNLDIYHLKSLKDKVQDLYPDITAKEIKEFIKNQEVEQINKKTT